MLADQKNRSQKVGSMTVFVVQALRRCTPRRRPSPSTRASCLTIVRKVCKDRWRQHERHIGLSDKHSCRRLLSPRNIERHAHKCLLWVKSRNRGTFRQCLLCPQNVDIDPGATHPRRAFTSHALARFMRLFLFGGCASSSSEATR